MDWQAVGAVLNLAEWENMAPRLAAVAVRVLVTGFIVALDGTSLRRRIALRATAAAAQMRRSCAAD